MFEVMLFYRLKWENIKQKNNKILWVSYKYNFMEFIVVHWCIEELYSALLCVPAY